MDEAQLEKVFNYIKGQFKGTVAVSCGIETEHLNWHIKATVITEIAGRDYEISRVTEDLMDHDKNEILSMVNGLVYTLKRVLCEEVFSNYVDAPTEIDW